MPRLVAGSLAGALLVTLAVVTGCIGPVAVARAACPAAPDPADPGDSADVKELRALRIEQAGACDQLHTDTAAVAGRLLHGSDSNADLTASVLARLDSGLTLAGHDNLVRLVDENGDYVDAATVASDPNSAQLVRVQDLDTVANDFNHSLWFLVGLVAAGIAAGALLRQLMPR